MDYTSFAPGGSTKQNTPVPSPFVPEPHKHFFNKKFAITFVILILLGVGAYAGIWYWQKQQLAQETVPTFTPRADDMANWKTYNVQNVFEIKYPNDLQIIDSSKTMNHDLYLTYATIQIHSGTEIRVMGLNPNTYETPADYVKKYGYSGSTNMIISGRQAIQSEPGGNGYFIDTVIFNAPNLFEVMYASDKEPTQSDRKLYNEILSTFKFIDSSSSVIYKNNQYGFSIALTDSWKGYTILNSQWVGRYVAEGKDNEGGPIITLRHPQWTSSKQREDMPVMIFTPEQWAFIKSGALAVGAAPIPPSVLGQNSKYIIALPARYNYDFKTGWEEVDQLVHNLKAFEPTP